MNEYKVMADYESVGLWKKRPDGVWTHSPDSIPTIDGLRLIEVFEEWIDLYEIVMVDPARLDEFNVYGLRLAATLQNAIGNDGTVAYEPTRV